MSVRYVQRETPPRPVASVLPADERAALDAAQRAMPLQRLTGNGMPYADAVMLQTMATDGVPWPQAASWIGDCNLLRAKECEQRGDTASAHLYFRYAAAAFRFGQSPFMLDDPVKLAIYRRSLEAFTQAARLATISHEKLAIPFGGSSISGWLIRPPGIERPSSVIMFGGADGWREEYYDGALFLIERGVAAVLIDGPGQGETRMIGGLFLDAAVERAFSTVVSFLINDQRTGDKVGIWGNSLGGNFALRAAAADPRIAACCDNSGPPDPASMLVTFPRIADRLRAMVGGLDIAATRTIFERLAITPRDNRVSCDLLMLQGNKDPLVSFADAQMIYESAPSRRKTMLVWDDGDHCIYNHSHEKHTQIADWFARALA